MGIPTFKTDKWSLRDSNEFLDNNAEQDKVEKHARKRAMSTIHSVYGSPTKKNHHGFYNRYLMHMTLLSSFVLISQI